MAMLTIGETIQGTAGVDAWTPRVYAAGLGSIGEKSTAVQIIGVDVARETQATRFDQKVVEGSVLAESASHEAVIGKGLAKILSAKIDSEIVIFSQGADGSIANDVYKIIGIAESGDDGTRPSGVLSTHRRCSGIVCA